MVGVRVLRTISPLLWMCSLGFASDTDEMVKHLENKLERNHQKIQALKKIQAEQVRLLKDVKSGLPKPAPMGNLLEHEYERYLPLPSAKFQLVAPNQTTTLRFRFLSQFDNGVMFNTRGLSINDGISGIPIISRNVVDRFWTFRLRPQLEAVLNKDVTVFFNPDFGLSQMRLFDGIIDVHRYRLFGIRVGKQVSLAAGYENIGSAGVVATMYPSYTTWLAPNREIGLVGYGSFGPSEETNYNVAASHFGFTDFFAYQLGILNGNADNTNPGLNPSNPVSTSSENVTTSSKAFEARVFTNPFVNSSMKMFKLLGFGASASTETVNNQRALPSILSVATNPIFSYVANVNANGLRARIHPQLFWRMSELGLIMEFTQTLQHLTPGPMSSSTQDNPLRQLNKANQIQLIYNLTGENVSLFEMSPARDFNLNDKSAYGALQLVLRMTGLHVDSSVFNERTVSQNTVNYVYSDPRISISKASSWSVGLNWYWNKNIKFSTEYAQTTFTGGCSTGALNAPVSPGCVTGFPYGRGVDSAVVNRPDEKIFSQRFQIFF